MNEIQNQTLRPQDIQTLIQVGVIPQQTPVGVIALFARFCRETGLSPFKKQTMVICRNSKAGPRFTIQTGIDGYRSIAESTGCYAGSDDYKFDEGISEYQHLQAGRGNPQTATATVYKIVSGQRVEFSATARWDEYCPGGENNQDFMWRSKPYLMLGKCAEALALRKAFPSRLGGIYTQEEMQHVAATAATVAGNVTGEPHGTPEAFTPEVESQLPPEETLNFEKWGGGKWRDVKVTWGTEKLKIKGKTLGQIAQNDVKAFHFLREVWKPKPYKGQIQKQDKTLREVLDVAHYEYVQHKRKIQLEQALKKEGLPVSEAPHESPEEEYYDKDQEWEAGYEQQ